jgi:hypothetical protein
MFFGQLKMNIALDDRKSTSTQRTLLAIVLVMSWFYVLLNTWHDSSHKKNTKELLRNSAAAVGIALKCSTLFSVLGFYVVRLNRNKTFCLLSLSLLFFLCIGEKHFVLDTDLKPKIFLHPFSIIRYKLQQAQT